ncbi:carbon-nitrogen hydrolase family protein [Sporobolomyces salmoneus]|uniref:carbon-nitrogen hydrolase family protein n=1 Tax=Sporobolomyces salmoneus TaxID=183962 RepID=UPI0031807EF4
MLAAVGQLCSTSNVARNTKIACDLISRASKANASLLFLPEATDFIAPRDRVKELSQSLDQPGGFVETLRKQARDSRIWVNVGVHEKGPEAENGRCYNTNLLIDDQGEVVERYRKLHLFDVAITGGTHIMESNTTIKGDRIVDPVATPIGKLGLTTCFDIRFPELSLSLRRRGAELLCYPSAFTVKTGKAHWETLLRARAIETQCYVFAAAQAGEHSPGRASYGHSLIIGPFGEILASIDNDSDSGSDEGRLITAEIDLPALEQIRKEIPLWDQRRNDLYPCL